MSKNTNVHPYDAAVLEALKSNMKVYTDFHGWLMMRSKPFDMNYFPEYLQDVGISTLIETVEHKRIRWMVNNVQYCTHLYRVSRNAHYSCIRKAIEIRANQLIK